MKNVNLTPEINVRRKGEVPPPLSEELATSELKNNFSGGIWVKRSGTALRLLDEVSFPVFIRELLNYFNYHFDNIRFYLSHLCIKCMIKIEKKNIKSQLFQKLILFPFEIRKVLRPKILCSREEILRRGVSDIRRFLDSQQ